jgi:hypothetical protein
MSNQRPPGGVEGPTTDPERERARKSAQPWVDPNRTQRYPDRRSIADRLRNESREPAPAPPPEPASEFGPGSTLGQRAHPRPAASARMRAVSRGGGGVRFTAIIAGVVVLGLAGGAAAAWFSGWRPGFLSGSTAEPGKAPGDKAAPGEARPGDPATPAAPPSAEIGRGCFSGTTEVKPGAAACGFALDPAGALSFQGNRIAERLASGSGAAQRVVLHPFAPSGRFVFLSACDAASGGRCAFHRLVDTKEKKLFEVKIGGEGIAWVAWSPKEQAALLGWRDGISETIAIFGTAGAEALRPSAIRTPRNRYALLHANSVRWGRDENSFSVELKLCPYAKGRARNTDCEQDEDIRFRRRTLKFER